MISLAVLENGEPNFGAEICFVNIKMSYLWTMKIRHAIFTAAFILFCVAHSFSQGCSQCRMMTEQGSGLDEDSFGNNINSGILYLMIIPYLLILFLFRHRIISFFRGLAKK
ncbi:MAG: hypothetical protein RL632_1139 [Bacteroidota bacterium]|jgi:hypothetical protein